MVAINPRLTPEQQEDWVVSHSRQYRANILVWGMSRSLAPATIRAKLADVGLLGFARGDIAWEGDHVRIVLTRKDSKGLSQDVVRCVSACLRKIGCRCVLDETVPSKKPSFQPLPCVNRYQLDVGEGMDDDIVAGGAEVDLQVVNEKVRESQNARKGLRVGTWNFSGLCSERKQREVGDVLQKLHLDIVAGQESWEKEGNSIRVDGYKWFGKPRPIQSSQRGEGGLAF